MCRGLSPGWIKRSGRARERKSIAGWAAQISEGPANEEPQTGIPRNYKPSEFFEVLQRSLERCTDFTPGSKYQRVCNCYGKASG
jgi:hypothetical protein